MEKYAAIGKENLKHNLPVHFWLCTALLLLSPFFIGLENLNQQESAKVLEYYPVFLGVILITPVFLPEQDQNIRDLTDSKYTGAWMVYGIRVLEALGALMVLLALYMAVMKMGNCQFAFGKNYLGALGGMLFLGCLDRSDRYWIYDSSSLLYALCLCRERETGRILSLLYDLGRLYWKSCAGSSRNIDDRTGNLGEEQEKIKME